MDTPKAFQLYDSLRSYASLSETSICMLHYAEPRTPCPQSSFFCGKESDKKAINFDAVKEHYCQQKKIKSVWASVDSVLTKDETFIFLEIKSWRNFDHYQLTPGDSPDVVKKKVEEKAKGFKLKEKIDKSILICEDVSGDEHLFDDLPVVYILVTDVDTIVTPLLRFRARLGILSYKAVNVPLYTRAAEAELKTTGMPVRYVYCRDFDSLYDSL